MDELSVFFTTASTPVIEHFAMAGGGGSSSSSSSDSSSSSSSSSPLSDYSSSSSGSYSGDSDPLSVLIGIGVFVIIFIAVTIFMTKSTKGLATALYASRLKTLQEAASKDSAWQNDMLTRHAADIFTQFQSDWSRFATPPMQTYLSPRYYEHMKLVLQALQLAGRQNLVENLTIHDVRIENIHDDSDNTKDTFSARIAFTATDVIRDSRSGRDLHRTQLTGTELYKFIRSGTTWLLDGIDQPTASLDMRNESIANFAFHNGMFYSLDWGHLLLPDRGQLFSGAKYDISDINNHTIGTYHGLLIQIYSYIAAPGRSPEYTVAQVNIPRSYGNIIVRRKNSTLFRKKPKDMQQIQTEWREFNNTYEVFATDPERATSLELLTPSYMEQLAAVPSEANIEVADNVIYLYTSQPSADYTTLLELLKAAFKEMKM